MTPQLYKANAGPVCGHVEKGSCPECQAEIEKRRQELLSQTGLGRRLIFKEVIRGRRLSGGDCDSVRGR